MLTIKTILYPTDFSEHSMVALPFALDLAKRYEAQLHCLYVIDMSYETTLQSEYILSMMNELPIDQKEQQKQAMKHMDEFVAEHMSELQNTILKEVFRYIVQYWKTVLNVVRT